MLMCLCVCKFTVQVSSLVMSVSKMYAIYNIFLIFYKNRILARKNCLWKKLRDIKYSLRLRIKLNIFAFVSLLILDFCTFCLDTCIQLCAIFFIFHKLVDSFIVLAVILFECMSMRCEPHFIYFYHEKSCVHLQPWIKHNTFSPRSIECWSSKIVNAVYDVCTIMYMCSYWSS